MKRSNKYFIYEDKKYEEGDIIETTQLGKTLKGILCFDCINKRFYTIFIPKLNKYKNPSEFPSGNTPTPKTIDRIIELTKMKPASPFRSWYMLGTDKLTVNNHLPSLAPTEITSLKLINKFPYVRILAYPNKKIFTMGDKRN